jgi:hypothetical protein
VKTMETAVEAMESMDIAPGALPHPGRVREQRLLSPKIGLQRRRHCITFLEKTSIHLGFSRRRLYIGGEALSEGMRLAHTIAWRGLGHPRHGIVWPAPGPPPALLLTSSRVRKNRNFIFCFVQFREYFLYNFSKTQKTGNWYCGISLIG